MMIFWLQNTGQWVETFQMIMLLMIDIDQPFDFKNPITNSDLESPQENEDE